MIILNKKQIAAYHFLRLFVDQYGCPPSYSNAMRTVPHSSKGSFRWTLEMLERAGWIKRPTLPGSKQKSIVVCGPSAIVQHNHQLSAWLVSQGAGL